MLSNITRRTVEKVIEHRLAFESQGAGFMFKGVLEEDGFRLLPLEPRRQESFQDAISRTWERVFIEDASWEQKIPAHGTCACGEEVWLEADYGHGIDCDCGRIYNMSGQELAPRSQWEDRYDEDSTQPYCVEFGYIGPGDEY